MQRRDFCNLIAMSAASTAPPGFAQASPDSQSALPEGFNHYAHD
ncbi:hypothetical protein [Occallatibacter riparius]|nr:hypothetical protein [Occallatibacter riparius]